MLCVRFNQCSTRRPSPERPIKRDNALSLLLETPKYNPPTHQHYATTINPTCPSIVTGEERIRLGGTASCTSNLWRLKTDQSSSSWLFQAEFSTYSHQMPSFILPLNSGAQQRSSATRKRRRGSLTLYMMPCWKSCLHIEA